LRSYLFKYLIFLLTIFIAIFVYTRSFAEQVSLSSVFEDVPPFAVRLSNGELKVFKRADLQGKDELRFSDENLEAAIKPLGNNQFELEISNKNIRIDQVWFPYQSDSVVLNSDMSDDMVYYPHFFGTVEKCDSNSSWDWLGFDYPGHTFAPLIIIADESDAFIVAAVNWPPKRIKPLYSKRRIRFLYYDIIEPGAEASYRLLVSRTKGDSTKGQYPWQLAIDKYKVWLKDKMRDEGLWPVVYPNWMKEIDGFLDVQLQNGPREFKIKEIYALWNKWNEFFPWIQFWGQMQDAIVNTPKKKLSHEQFHKMLEQRKMHRRYGTELIEFAKNITSNPGFQDHVGFYTKSRKEKPLLDQNELVDGETSLEFLMKWLKINAEHYNANVHYIDTLGNGYMGDPLFVAKLFVTQFPKNIIIEYPVDIYPTAFYVSGSLSAGINRKKWGQKPKDLLQGKNKITFPRFGRYLLDDRFIFMGQGNGDHVYWGRKGNYWCERQAFLLGAKYEVITAADNPNDSNSDLNKAIKFVILERRRTGWWERNPLYLDTKGISYIPEQVEVRRFTDKDGIDLFVIDNWQQHKALKFMFKNKWIKIPEEKLSILQMKSVFK